MEWSWVQWRLLVAGIVSVGSVKSPVPARMGAACRGE
jgi:hypothetical protein